MTSAITLFKEEISDLLGSYYAFTLRTDVAGELSYHYVYVSNNAYLL